MKELSRWIPTLVNLEARIPLEDFLARS